MDTVVRGNNIVREAHFLLDGVLTDPSNPRVTIRDPLGVAQVTDAVPTRISQGIYQYTYFVAVDALIGIWETEWQGTVASQALGPIDDPFQVIPTGSISPTLTGSYSYDLTTSVGVVRLLTDDRDMTAVSTTLPLEQRSAIWTDEEINQFLLLAGNDVLRAAAQGLRVLAGNRSLLVQSRRVGKAELDYGSIRRDLLAQAEALITQSNETPADGYVEQIWDDFSLRRLIGNVQLRQDLG